jgi:poly(3-hydroxybutyrate) depolymerase
MLVGMNGCSSSATAVMDRGTAGAPAGTGFTIKTVQNQGRNRKYALFIPHGYTPGQKWPAIVFLHGVGEGGTGAQHNLTVGLAPIVAQKAAQFQFIVIFPQSATGHWDENSDAAADAIAALDEVEHDYAVDRDRVFLTGLSTGGYGTWAIGAKYKEHFAGLVPMCAFSDFKDVDKLADVPVWCFHNAGDPFVLAAGDHAMCDQINARGGHAKYTEYVALGHDVWTRAYQKDELYQWMLETRRTTAEPGGQNAAMQASADDNKGILDATLIAAPAPAGNVPAPHVNPPAYRSAESPLVPEARPVATPAASGAGHKSDAYVPMVW